MAQSKIALFSNAEFTSASMFMQKIIVIELWKCSTVKERNTSYWKGQHQTLLEACPPVTFVAWTGALRILNLSVQERVWLLCIFGKLVISSSSTKGRSGCTVPQEQLLPSVKVKCQQAALLAELLPSSTVSVLGLFSLSACVPCRTLMPGSVRDSYSFSERDQGRFTN